MYLIIESHTYSNKNKANKNKANKNLYFQNYNKEIVMDRRSFLEIGSGSLAISAMSMSSTASALLNCSLHDY